MVRHYEKLVTVHVAEEKLNLLTDRQLVSHGVCEKLSCFRSRWIVTKIQIINVVVYHK